MSQHLREQWGLRVEAANGLWYHLTDKAQFQMQKKVPADNAMSIRSRDDAGLFLASNPEPWVNGHGYLRPFLVEVQVSSEVLREERWGGEMFLPAEHFGQARIVRVIPIDAYCREKYGDWGWVEETIDVAFDTGEPIPGDRSLLQGWRYSGPDVRSMDSGTVSRLKADCRKARSMR